MRDVELLEIDRALLFLPATSTRSCYRSDYHGKQDAVSDRLTQSLNAHLGSERVKRFFGGCQAGERRVIAVAIAFVIGSRIGSVTRVGRWRLGVGWCLGGFGIGGVRCGRVYRSRLGRFIGARFGW